MGPQDLVGVGTEHLSWGAGDEDPPARRRREGQRPAGRDVRLGPGLPGEAALSPAQRAEGAGRCVRGGARRREGGAVAELSMPALPASSVLSLAGGDPPLEGSGH